MLCATSCVLSICLNCQNKWEKMTLHFAYQQQKEGEMEVLVHMHVIVQSQEEQGYFNSNSQRSVNNKLHSI